MSKVALDYEAISHINFSGVMDLEKSFNEEIGGISDWVESQYNQYFAKDFEIVRNLQAAFNSETKQISDTDLERIMTELPIRMAEASEHLNSYKLKANALKLKTSVTRNELMDTAEGGTKAEKTEAVNAALLNYDLLACAYDGIISRVDRELVYAKELIMGAKKVWTARTRATEDTAQSEPPLDSEGNLPEYRAYIR